MTKPEPARYITTNWKSYNRALKHRGSLLIWLDKCLIPRFDGVILSREWKDAVWDKFVMEAPRLRTLSEQQYSDRKLRSRS